MSARDDYPRLAFIASKDDESPSGIELNTVLNEIDELRAAIDQLAELLAGSPIWGLIPEAYSCKADLAHQQWLVEFTGDMQRILHPLRPEMVASP